MDSGPPEPTPTTVFDKTYETYVAQVRDIDFQKIAPHLGAEFTGERLVIPLFNTTGWMC